jgi:hypothetical protein
MNCETTKCALFFILFVVLANCVCRVRLQRWCILFACRKSNFQLARTQHVRPKVMPQSAGLHGNLIIFGAARVAHFTRLVYLSVFAACACDGAADLMELGAPCK